MAMGEKSAEASTPMPPSEVRYGASISPSEVATAVNSFIANVTGIDRKDPSVNASVVSKDDLELRDLALNSTVSVAGPGRNTDDSMTAARKANWLQFVREAFPPSSLSFDVPNSQPWSEEFQISTLGKEWGIGNDH